jgi:Cu(I)/Ag(I) efflux system protein CusF
MSFPTLTSILAVIGVALTLAAPALAQHSGHGSGSPTAPAAELPWAEAEVRRVDREAGKLSLRHGEIRNLEMPPMTMVFSVQNRSVLEGLQPGDRIRFTADQIQGAYTVLKLEKLR